MTEAEFNFADNYNDADNYWRGLGWGGGVESFLKRLSLIANDHSFTFRTTEQRWDGTRCVYGPKPVGPTWEPS